MRDNAFGGSADSHACLACQRAPAVTEVGLTVSEEFISLADATLYVKRWIPVSPNGSALCPLILLHDSLGCVEMWRQFPAVLAHRLLRPVIAYDRWGFGRSSARLALPSAGFVNEEAEIYFPRIKELLGIANFVVFGHSVGGAMAVAVAARYADECRAVVTEAAQAFVEPKTLASIAEGKSRFANPHEMAKLARYHGDKANWVVDAWTETWLSREFAAWSLKPELPMVRCPLLAIHGDGDEYGSLAFPRTLSSMTAGPTQQMILEDCGHVPHREKEELVLNGTRHFLNALIP